MDTVDRNALRVNQGAIVAFLVLAWLLAPVGAGLPLVAFVAAVMALGTAVPRLSLFKWLYSGVLKPAGILRPDVVREDAAQHRFAQGMGAAFLIAALIVAGPLQSTAGWALVAIVVALALVNLVFGFCAGCFVYTQLHLSGLTRRGANAQ